MTGENVVDVQLYNTDCIPFMQAQPDNVFDLTVTSPPYDNLRTYGKDFDAAKFDWRTIIAELYRVTKVGGVVVWVVADATIKGSETGTSFRQALWAMECGFNLHDTMIYQKKNYAPYYPGTNRYAGVWEFMFIFSVNKPKTFNAMQWEKSSATFSRYGGAPHKYQQPDGTWKSKQVDASHRKTKDAHNVWMYGVGNQKNGHPAPFPEFLARDHILSWSNAGDTVFDPMMGSGTTGKMAKLHGRNFVGCELDAGYYEIARQRIEAAQVQPTLFQNAAD